jgi:lipid A oxidase
MLGYNVRYIEMCPSHTRYGRGTIIRIVATVALVAVVTSAHAESFVAFYGGVSDSDASDVRLRQPNGTDLTFHGVNWSERSLERPYYWGMRIGYWRRSARSWGVALDLTHAKVYADLDEDVAVRGERLGVSVDTVERLGDTFIDLSMSHGLNLLTVNGLYRWDPAGGIATVRLRPYVGLGAGIVIPHVEVKTATTRNDAYQIAGWVVDGLVGLNFKFDQGISAFLEYRLSHTDVSADLSGGGSLDTRIATSHYDLGVSYEFQ